MKIILINPRVTDTSCEPLGIMYIAAVLEKAGNKVIIIDTIDDVSKKVVSLKPDLVGFSVTTPQIKIARQFALKIKKLNPNIKTVVGGVHPTIMPLQTIKEPAFDFAVIGEGEYVLLDLVNAIKNKKPLSKVKGLAYKINNKPKINPRRELIKDLDELPYPARHLVDMSWYLQPPGRIRGYWTNACASLLATRGCPYNCTFCSSNLMWLRRVRRRSISSIIDEIKFLIKKYHADSLRFVDDELIHNKEWAKTLAREMIKNKFNLIWTCQGRVDTADLETYKLLRKAGCIQIDFGVESGSPKILNSLNKHTTPEQIKNAITTAKKAGIRAMATCIIGSPGETLDDIKKTEEVVKDADYVEYYFSTPYPGTSLYEQTIKKELSIDDYQNLLYARTQDEPSLVIGEFTSSELTKIRGALYNKRFFKNYLTFLKNPFNIIRITKILIGGFPGLAKGFKRLIKTKRIDSLIYSMLEYKRFKTLKAK